MTFAYICIGLFIATAVANGLVITARPRLAPGLWAIETGIALAVTVWALAAGPWPFALIWALIAGASGYGTHMAIRANQYRRRDAASQ